MNSTDYSKVDDNYTDLDLDYDFVKKDDFFQELLTQKNLETTTRDDDSEQFSAFIEAETRNVTKPIRTIIKGSVINE